MDQRPTRGKHDPETHRPDRRRRAARFTSLFPGLIRLIFPERSFTPVSIAARVLNLSSGGAMVEVPGESVEDASGMRGTYCELRIAAGRKVALFGRVARAEAREGKCLLGLMFHRSHPELIGDLVHGETSEIEPDALLPFPVLHPFSPLIEEETAMISGDAPDADEVVVENPDGKATAVPVRDGVFRLTLQVEEEGMNTFQIFSRRGSLRSVPQKIDLIHVPLTSEEFHFSLERSESTATADGVRCEFLGGAGSARDLMESLAELVESSTRVKLTMKAQSPQPFSDELIESIRRRAAELRRQSGVHRTMGKVD